MSLRVNLDEYYSHLESTRSTDRRKACEKIIGLLNNKVIIDMLNEKDSISWNSLLQATMKCLRMEAEKISEEIKKKGKFNDHQIFDCKELFLQIIKFGSQKENKNRLNIVKLVKYINGCLRDKVMKRCYEATFLVALKDHILNNYDCTGEIDDESWTLLLEICKQLVQETGSHKSDENLKYKCLLLVIKYGPLSALSVTLLREQFQFITQLALSVNQNSPRYQQEDVMEVVLEFCKHVAEDNRVSCCKLGEDVISSLMDIYELNGHESKIKVNMIEFFLLQVMMHHPDGVSEGDSGSYSTNWANWKLCLRKIYTLLIKEIGFYFKNNTKNTYFFIPQGKQTVMLDSFVALFVEVSRQVMINSDMILSMTLVNDTSMQPHKKQRIEVNMRSFISNIADTKSWVWIKLVSSMLKMYPTSIDEHLFLNLLRVLQTIQIDTHDNNVMNNTYECLSIMLEVQHSLDIVMTLDEVTKLWKLIGESTLRAVGLNQNIKETQSLLQKLILKGNCIELHMVLQTYISGAVSMTEYSIQTLDVVLQQVNVAHINTFQREALVDAILNVENLKDNSHFFNPKTAKILANLTLQQWHFSEWLSVENNLFDRYDGLKDLYLKSIFEKDFDFLVGSSTNVKTSHIPKVESPVDEVIKIKVLNGLKLVSHSENAERLLSSAILLANVYSFFCDYGISTTDELRNLERQIKSILNCDTVVTSMDQFKTHNEKVLKNIMSYIAIVNGVFAINNKAFRLIKDFIPLQFLQSLFRLLNYFQEDMKKTNENYQEIKIALTKALSKFCFNSHSHDLNLNQTNAMRALSKPDYNYRNNDDYILNRTFLEEIKNSLPGLIPDEVLSSILVCLKEMCTVRYQKYDDAICILTILYDLIPHLAPSKDEENKETVINLLYPFYIYQNNYGPEVPVCVLKCIKRLCEIDSKFEFSLWDGVEIIKKVPEFLCSCYQKVRFKAIDTLVAFFQTGNIQNHVDFQRQQEVFSIMYDKSLSVFNVNGELTEERRIDETIFRTASAIHTFSSILLTSVDWVVESFLALMKLEHKKKLESSDKLLFLFEKHLSTGKHQYGLDEYVDSIISLWLSEGCHINDFQFSFFKCNSKLEFYQKYFDICVPLLIQSDMKDIIQVGGQLGMSEKEILRKSCAHIFAKALCDNFNSFNRCCLEIDVIKYLYDRLGDSNLKEALMSDIDRLLLCLFTSITDEKYIINHFNEVVVFRRKGLTLSEFTACLEFVQDYLYKSDSIISVLLQSQLFNIERILLKLKLNVSKAVGSKRLQTLHHYAIFVSSVLEYLESNSVWVIYFIRDTVYFLIHMTENHKDDIKFIKAVCKYLYEFLMHILPNSSDAFEGFFVFVVNAAKKLYTHHPSLEDCCVDILNFLIVDNVGQLRNVIEKLNAFPDTTKFTAINNIHSSVKSKDKQMNLQDEILHFLYDNSSDAGQDSLCHLKNVLYNNKLELKEMYDKLQTKRGISEDTDCENSVLHRLICKLVKLNSSTDETVRTEAMKCLGELGPGNLKSVVLQPEKQVPNVNCNAFELLCGHVISLLSDYIIDADMQVVDIASKILYHVLNTKEGKKLIDMKNDTYNIICPINRQYILPYLPLSKPPVICPKIDIKMFLTAIENNELWVPRTPISHRDWITQLVTSLLKPFDKRCFLPDLVLVCALKVKFCEQILPLIIYLLLYTNDSSLTNLLSMKMNYFFSKHWELTAHQQINEDVIPVNKRSIKCMLNVVDFLRQKEKLSSSKLRNEHLNLNFLPISKAAEFCAAHFTAVLYAELWCQTRILEIEKTLHKDSNVLESGYTKLDFIFENEDQEVGQRLQSVLRNAYKAIGDLDALPGCGISFLLQPQFRVEHYKELEQWDQVTHYYAMQIAHGYTHAKTDYIESLKNSDRYQIPILCSDVIDESQYECFWRLGQWCANQKSMKVNETVNTTHYEKYKFYALKSVHDKDNFTFSESKKMLSLCISDKLRHTSLESSENIYPILCQLQSLTEIDEFFEATKSKDFSQLLKKWRQQEQIIRNNRFKYVEPIIAQRITMLKDVMTDNAILKEQVALLVLDFADYAKNEGSYKVAKDVITDMQFVSGLSENIKAQIQLKEAELAWLCNDLLVARHVLTKLSQNENFDAKLKSSCLKMLGTFMIETCCENRENIIQHLFTSVDLLENSNQSERDTLEDMLDTYDKIATFADREYQHILTHMKSDLFQRKVANMKTFKDIAKSIIDQRKKTDDEKKAAIIHKRQSDIDELEIENTKKEKNSFLSFALKYYIKNLTHTDVNNIKIFRVISLLLENKENPCIVEILNNFLPEIPTYKYIAMLPQLIPHISEISENIFNKHINKIVEKCATDHPHHTLYLLLSLANSNKERDYMDSRTKTYSNDARIMTARNMLKKLSNNSQLSDIIKKLQLVCEALIQLAYYKETTTNERKREFNIPNKLTITKIKNFDNVLLPTYTLEVNKAKKYHNVIGISHFGSTYSTVGGINAPKRIVCRGTDGKNRLQLVKGHDDLRQDAVMQQVFTIMNSLLHINKQTTNLFIRTYKIVPLSMRSGVLEWVDNTMPIGEYLVGEGNTGAHAQYRPSDRSPADCRNTFKRGMGRSPEEKLKIFKQLCKEFKPIFYKFFEDSFPQPAVWYQRRSAYVHSVATSSMCGYILGIGDRHVSNILIDKTTAEVVHIDFGIAFEQGRCLPTPETVPFRLTRDIVSGMGVSGVEGLFRRSCEKTMDVLRKNSQTIITILEVLLYDPLYVWTVSPAEANKRQTDDEFVRGLSEDSDEDNRSVENKNITAERALLRLRAKLQGTENGKPTNIEHQVRTLIQQAMDPCNLCRLFHGWQPYL